MAAGWILLLLLFGSMVLGVWAKGFWDLRPVVLPIFGVVVLWRLTSLFIACRAGRVSLWRFARNRPGEILAYGVLITCLSWAAVRWLHPLHDGHGASWEDLQGLAILAFILNWVRGAYDKRDERRTLASSPH
jgi:hypothetical protein